VADVRHKLSRGGGNLGSTNSVAYLFDRRGQIYVDAAGVDEDTLIEQALEAGAEDVRNDDGQFVVSTDPAALHAVKSALADRGIAAEEAAIEYVPKTTVRVEGKDAESLVKLLEALEDLDDVQKVEGNFDIDADALAEA
jgi:transcriptional/translational regulatory protein YebC/TACO1